MSTVTKKPTSTKKKADDFIDQAGSNLAEGEVKKAKPKKSQVPLIIHPQLLKQLDEYLEEYIQSSSMGMSRSNYICQAIKEKLDRDTKV